MARCAGCHASIEDRFFLAVRDHHFHERCLHCELCQRLLSDRCFLREGKLFCITDYFRAFGPKCPACREGLGPEDLVQRARGRPYHLKCFVCNFCQQPLNTGDQFYLPDSSSSPVCKADAVLLTGEGLEPQNLAPKEDEGDSSEVGETGSSEVSDDKNDGKRRGPRTTIKAKQLECLKAAFNASPKPTRIVRERLAQETGLTMRVIQVWFQNRRSKERRLKQLSALGARRALFRGGRRLRAMRLLPEDADLPIPDSPENRTNALPCRNMAEYLAVPPDQLHDFDINILQRQASAFDRLTLFKTNGLPRVSSEPFRPW